MLICILFIGYLLPIQKCPLSPRAVETFRRQHLKCRDRLIFNAELYKWNCSSISWLHEVIYWYCTENQGYVLVFDDLWTLYILHLQTPSKIEIKNIPTNVKSTTACCNKCYKMMLAFLPKQMCLPHSSFTLIRQDTICTTEEEVSLPVQFYILQWNTKNDILWGNLQEFTILLWKKYHVSEDNFQTRAPAGSERAYAGSSLLGLFSSVLPSLLLQIPVLVLQLFSPSAQILLSQILQCSSCPAPVNPENTTTGISLLGFHYRAE